MSLSLFELFKIGIGPSSSHTVGPMVAAKSFVDLLEVNQQLPQVHRVRIDLFGSLALTGLGHATDRAVLLGLTGEIPQIVEPDRAEHLFHAVSQSSRLWLNGKHEIAFELKTDLCFNFQTFLLEHSNGMGFKAYDAAGIVLLEKTYFSIGGGLVRAREEMHAKDPNLKAPDSKAAIPFPFANAAQLEQQCLENDLTIAQVMRANESALDPSRDIDASLQAIWDAMHRAIELGCGTPGLLPGPQKVRRRAPELYRELRSHAKRNVADQFEMMDWVSLYAMAVNEQNAAGGRVVTAPTNGAAGVIPAVLNYFLQFSPAATDEGVAEFLLTAGAIGLLYQRNASISAAEVGCQGEIGVACSMAAAGLCAVLGGSVAQIENAAEIGMEHNLGLTCDPVGGLVQVPCIERNTMGAVKAINAARLALRGDGEHLVSLDSVISTMLQTGRDMQTNYKETSLGGLAVNVVAC